MLCMLQNSSGVSIPTSGFEQRRSDCSLQSVPKETRRASSHAAAQNSCSICLSGYPSRTRSYSTSTCAMDHSQQVETSSTCCNRECNQRWEAFERRLREVWLFEDSCSSRRLSKTSRCSM